MTITMANWLERRKPFLTCGICMDVYKEPKFLPCCHTYCAICLQRLIDFNKSRSITCPHCRSPTTIPEGGVSQLTDNFYLIKRDLEKARHGVLCPEHDNMMVYYFCVDCDQTACFDCKLSDHHNHEFIEYTEAVQLKQNQITEAKERLERAAALLKMEKNVICLNLFTLKLKRFKTPQKCVSDASSGNVMNSDTEQQTDGNIVDDGTLNDSRKAEHTTSTCPMIDMQTCLGDVEDVHYNNNLTPEERQRLHALDNALVSTDKKLSEVKMLLKQAKKGVDATGWWLLAIGTEMTFGKGSVDAVEKLVDTDFKFLFVNDSDRI